MKPRLLILTLLLAACISPMRAADTDSIAVHNIAAAASFDIDIPSGSHGSWSTASGVTAGIYYAVRPSVNWFAATALNAFYHTYGTGEMIADGSVYDGTVRNFGLAIPLLAGYTTSVAHGIDMSVATGPELLISLYARQYASPDFNLAGRPILPPSVNLFSKGFRRVSAVWRIALGFTFAGHYYIGLDGGVAFTPMAKYGNRDNKIKVRGNTIAIKLAYRF